HGRHLEGRRGGGQTDAHRREPPAPLPDEPREEGCRAVRERLREHGAREAVDLDDQHTASRRLGCPAAVEPPHEPVEPPLEAQDEVVEGHPSHSVAALARLPKASSTARAASIPSPYAIWYCLTLEGIV